MIHVLRIFAGSIAIGALIGIVLMPPVVSGILSRLGYYRQLNVFLFLERAHDDRCYLFERPAGDVPA